MIDRVGVLATSFLILKFKPRNYIIKHIISIQESNWFLISQNGMLIDQKIYLRPLKHGINTKIPFGNHVSEFLISELLRPVRWLHAQPPWLHQPLRLHHHPPNHPNACPTSSQLLQVGCDLASMTRGPSK